MTAIWPESRRITGGLVLLLVIITLFASQLIRTLRDHQRLVLDLAELNGIEYGLLNADAWLQQIGTIVEKKIDQFEVTRENRALLKANLQRVLETLITEADRYMRKQKKNQDDGWWKRTKGKVKQQLRDSLVNIEDIKRGIPTYADQILDEMSKPEARKDLKAFLRSLLANVSASTFATVDDSRILAAHAQYQCADRGSCTKIIQAAIDDNHAQALWQAAAVLGLTALLFAGVWLAPGERGPGRLALLAGCSAVLMLCGVLTPMLDIEARISELRFVLLGEPVVFTDQILYFQSKSVMDVVEILIATGAADMFLVGILLVMFSVIFPLAKLGTSLVYVYNLRGWRENALVRFFTLKSGKWSMADVFVVSMFMAYIGFSGLAASQLANFAAAGGDDVEVLTTNGTSLQIGFFMFLAFCIASLLTSTLIEFEIGHQAPPASTGARPGPNPHLKSRDAAVRSPNQRL